MCNNSLALFMGALLEHHAPIKDYAIVTDNCRGIPESAAKSAAVQRESYTSFSSSLPELSRWDSTPISPDLKSRKVLKNWFPACPRRSISFEDELELELSDEEEQVEERFVGVEGVEEQDGSQRLPDAPFLPELDLHPLQLQQQRSLPCAITRLQRRHARAPHHRCITCLDSFSRKLARKIQRNSLPPKVPVRKPSLHEKQSDENNCASVNSDNTREPCNGGDDSSSDECSSDSDSEYDSDLEFASDNTPPVFQDRYSSTPSHYVNQSNYFMTSFSVDSQVPETKLVPRCLLKVQDTLRGFNLLTYLSQQGFCDYPDRTNEQKMGMLDDGGCQSLSEKDIAGLDANATKTQATMKRLRLPSLVSSSSSKLDTESSQADAVLSEPYVYVSET